MEYEGVENIVLDIKLVTFILAIPVKFTIAIAPGFALIEPIRVAGAF